MMNQRTPLSVWVNEDGLGATISEQRRGRRRS